MSILLTLILIRCLDRCGAGLFRCQHRAESEATVPPCGQFVAIGRANGCITSTRGAGPAVV